MQDWTINVIGVLATCGGYKIARTILREAYKDSGTITRIGLNIICGYIGLTMGSTIVKRAVSIKKEVDKINSKKERNSEDGGDQN